MTNSLCKLPDVLAIAGIKDTVLGGLLLYSGGSPRCLFFVSLFKKMWTTGRDHETLARVSRMPQVLCALCAYMLVILACQSAEAAIFRGQVPLKIQAGVGYGAFGRPACGRHNKRVSSVPAGCRKGTVGTLGMQMGQKDDEDKGGNRGEKYALGWEESEELAPGELKTTWRRVVGEIKYAQRQQVAPWVARSESRRITADLMDMLRSEETQGNIYSRASLFMYEFLSCESVFTCMCIK